MTHKIGQTVLERRGVKVLRVPKRELDKARASD